MNIRSWEACNVDDTTVGCASQLTVKIKFMAAQGAHPERIDVHIDWRNTSGISEALASERLGLALSVLHMRMMHSVFSHVSKLYPNLFHAAHIQNTLATHPLICSVASSVAAIMENARTREPIDQEVTEDAILCAVLPPQSPVRSRPPPLVLSDDVLASIPPSTPPLLLSTPPGASPTSSPAEWATPRSMPSSPLAT